MDHIQDEAQDSSWEIFGIEEKAAAAYQDGDGRQGPFSHQAFVEFGVDSVWPPGEIEHDETDKHLAVHQVQREMQEVRIRGSLEHTPLAN